MDPHTHGIGMGMGIGFSPVGIHMGIPTEILWEWEWKFPSHGNPGSKAFIFLILLDKIQFEVEVNNLANISQISVPQLLHISLHISACSFSKTVIVKWVRIF